MSYSNWFYIDQSVMAGTTRIVYLCACTQLYQHASGACVFTRELGECSCQDAKPAIRLHTLLATTDLCLVLLLLFFFCHRNIDQFSLSKMPSHLSFSFPSPFHCRRITIVSFQFPSAICAYFSRSHLMPYPMTQGVSALA